MLEGLVAHAEDANDHNLPLMVWYALEPSAAAEPQWAVDLALTSKLPGLLRNSVRRVAALGKPEAFDVLVAALAKAETDPIRLTILEAVNESLQGRRQVDMPRAWPPVFAELGASPNAEVRSQATALAVTFGDPTALASLRTALSDPSKTDADPAAKPWRPC